MENDFSVRDIRRIVIIGSGNVAYHLSKAFVSVGLPLVQLFGRNRDMLHRLSDEVAVPYSTDKLASADLYILCVSDSSISAVSELIKDKNAIVAHTSGSTAMEILCREEHRVVLYPLQTFSKMRHLDYSKIPFFFEAEDKADEVLLENLLRKISQNVMACDSERRKYIHLTAVFSCNFVNHLFARAKEIADEHHLPFEFFLPLIDETIAKIHSLDPKKAQTGPAVRGDEKVLELQKKLITNAEQAEIYDLLSQSIKKMYY